MDGRMSALLSHLFGVISLIGVCGEALIWRLLDEVGPVLGSTPMGEQQRQRRAEVRGHWTQASKILDQLDEDSAHNF